MSRCPIRFLLKQTLIAILLNGLFSAVAVLLVFPHKPRDPLYGSPSLIADSILQTFIATLMSVLPPSIMTAKWMLARPDLAPARTHTAKILARALFTALAACLASFVVFPFAIPRLLTAPLAFPRLLLLKCIYGMAIGLAVTPFAITAVLRGPRRYEATSAAPIDPRCKVRIRPRP